MVSNTLHHNSIEDKSKRDWTGIILLCIGINHIIASTVSTEKFYPSHLLINQEKKRTLKIDYINYSYIAIPKVLER